MNFSVLILLIAIILFGVLAFRQMSALILAPVVTIFVIVLSGMPILDTLLLLLLIPFFLRKSEWTNGDFSALLPPVVFVLLFLAIQYLFSHAEEKRAERLEKRYDAEDETK
mgnify:CR=1 FL=1